MWSSEIYSDVSAVDVASSFSALEDRNNRCQSARRHQTACARPEHVLYLCADVRLAVPLIHKFTYCVVVKANRSFIKLCGVPSGRVRP